MAGDDTASIDLLMDLETLIGRGLSDADIARELELSDPALVGYLRTRLGDFRPS